MGKWWKHRSGRCASAGAAFTAVTGTVWTAERWIGLAGLPDDASALWRGLNKVPAMIPQEVYLAAITAGLTVTVIFGVMWLTEYGGPVRTLRCRRQTREFQALVDDLLEGVHKHYGERNQPKDDPEIRSIVRKLDALDIPHPSLHQSRDIWNLFLYRIAGEAKAGALDEGRCVWDELCAEARRRLRELRATEGEDSGESQ